MGVKKRLAAFGDLNGTWPLPQVVKIN